MKRLVLAEFAEPEPMVEAARKLRESGREGLDAYSPYPVHGIDEALELPRSKVPLVALIAGLSGAASGYVLQWWTNAVDYEIVLVPNRGALIELAAEFGYKTVPLAHNMSDYTGMSDYRIRRRLAFIVTTIADNNGVISRDA